MFRFPWGDMHSLNLGWFLQKFNELREDWVTAEAGIDGALDAEIQKAEDALSDVFAARDAAAASASAANSSALNASQSSLASMDARDQSIAARDAAQQAAVSATASETTAGNSATAAAGSATAAGQSATNAAASETAAGQSASAAAASATAAETSETNAAASAARAEEVEQSIPEDYTQLSNDFTRLRAVFNTEETLLSEPLDFTIQTGDTQTHTYITNLYLTPGEYFLTYEQETEILTSTRNTAFYKPSGGSLVNEFSFSNANKKPGLYIWKITIDTAGYYDFGFWGHTLSAAASYKNFTIRKTSLWYSIGSALCTFNNGFSAKSPLAANTLIFVFGNLYKTTGFIANASDIVEGSNATRVKIADFLPINY